MSLERHRVSGKPTIRTDVIDQVMTGLCWTAAVCRSAAVPWEAALIRDQSAGVQADGASWLVVVPSAGDGVAARTEQQQHQSDDGDDQANRPEDGDIGDEPDDEENDSENDHDICLISV